MVKKMYPLSEVKEINSSLELIKNIEWALENCKLNETLKMTLENLKLDMWDRVLVWAAPSVSR